MSGGSGLELELDWDRGFRGFDAVSCLGESWWWVAWGRCCSASVSCSGLEVGLDVHLNLKRGLAAWILHFETRIEAEVAGAK